MYRHVHKPLAQVIWPWRQTQAASEPVLRAALMGSLRGHRAGQDTAWGPIGVAC